MSTPVSCLLTFHHNGKQWLSGEIEESMPRARKTQSKAGVSFASKLASAQKFTSPSQKHNLDLIMKKISDNPTDGHFITHQFSSKLLGSSKKKV